LISVAEALGERWVARLEDVVGGAGDRR